jgi:hypothetical protein
MGTYEEGSATSLWSAALPHAETANQLLAPAPDVTLASVLGAVALGMALRAWLRLRGTCRMRGADPLGCGPPL